MTTPDLTLDDQDRLITEAVERDRPRLRSFIRARVLSDTDAEDILQDVFYELLNAYRLLKPAEQLTAWLYRVARNRITDLFRRKPALSLNQTITDDDEQTTFEDLLPSPEAGPDALYARSLLFEAMDEALDELPANQREVFLAHELEGRSFKELAEESGIPINTLLARKRYAVLYLRKRLQQLNETL